MPDKEVVDNSFLQPSFYADDIVTLSSYKNVSSNAVMKNYNIKGKGDSNKSNPPLSMITLMKEDSSTAEETCSPLEDDDSSCSSSSSSSSSSISSNSVLSDSDSSYTMISSQSDNKLDEKENTYIFAYLKKLKLRKGKDYADALESLQIVIDKEAKRNRNGVKPVEEVSLSDKYNESVSCNGNSCYRDKISKQIRFEVKYFLPTAMANALYCIAHVSIYELLNTIIIDTTKEYEGSSHLIFICSILAALVLSRLSGSAWHWLSDELYSGAKIELKQRARLGFIDTKVQLWFKKHKALRTAISILCFYLIHMSMVYFLCNVFLPYVGDSKQYFLDHLPSHKLHNTTTSVSQLLTRAIHGQEETDSCEITQNDYDFMYDKVTAASYGWFFGSPEVALVTTTQAILFYAVVASCTSIVMAKLGIELF